MTNEEDIVSRLEALRKRVPEEEERPPEKPTPKRRRLARIVGTLVILSALSSVFFLGYSLLLKPAWEKRHAMELERLQQERAFVQAKSEKLDEITDAFAGLPSEYLSGRQELLDRLERATSLSEVEAINVTQVANSAWRSYWLDEIEKTAKRTKRFYVKLGNQTFHIAVD
jgi:hypothetical protein